MLGHGGIDAGPLGLRLQYGPGYDAGFVVYPDGDKPEAVVQ